MFSTQAFGDVMILAFDRPEKKNALTPKMLLALERALTTSLSARALLLMGEGDVFCAGFDLSACRDDPESGILKELMTLLSRVARSLRSAPCPVVVCAHGAALAGGCALAAAADFVVTHDDARIGYPVVRLGISPAVSGPALATSTTHGQARARLLDSGSITGRDALRIGLAHACEPNAAACIETARRLATHLASKPAHAMGYTKRWMNELDGSLEDSRHQQALAASLARVGSAEERALLSIIWKT